MNPKPFIRIFKTKTFLIIEFVFLALMELSRLTSVYELLKELCGGGSSPGCVGNACTTVIPTISCSKAFGNLGVLVFFLLFLGYIFTFILYRIIKKDFKNSLLPIAIAVAAYFLADFIVHSLT